MKKSQKVMIWFLPLIVIGGLFIPLLGYLVVAMMIFLLILSVFKGRYWCWNLCPRGAFLDGVLSKVSLKRPVPNIFLKQWFRWLVVSLFTCFLIYQIIKTGANPVLIGAVFVSMCLLTTVIAIILGVASRHRSWCVICPMGTLQDKINRISKPQ
jgi:polyferredoxin